MRLSGLDVGTGSRRRAGSCPPEGRMASSPVFGTSRAMRGFGAMTPSFGLAGLGGLGTTLAGTNATFPHLAAGIGSNITAHIVSTDSAGSMDMSSSRLAAVPGTLQLTVLVPVRLGPPRRTEADVAGIGTTWIKGSDQAQLCQEIPVLNKMQSAMHLEPNQECSVEGGNDDTCGICLQAFKDGEKLTALPCATGVCPSIWHEECVRKWLCQGDTPTCPLCRTRMEIDGPGGNPTSNSSFAVEVRVALPLAAASAMAANSSGAGGLTALRDFDSTAAGARSSADGLRSQGLGASNQLLRQLGQGIIQDILLLTLSQRSSSGLGTGTGLGTGAGNNSNNNFFPRLPNLPPYLPNVNALSQAAAAAAANAAQGHTNTNDAATSMALADLGGLLLRSLATHGNLPVMLSAVEIRAAGSNGTPGRGGTVNPRTADSNGRRSGTGGDGHRHRRRRRKAGTGQPGAEEASPSASEGAQHSPASGSGYSWSQAAGTSQPAPARGYRGSARSWQQPRQLRWVPVGSRDSPVNHASSAEAQNHQSSDSRHGNHWQQRQAFDAVAEPAGGRHGNHWQQRQARWRPRWQRSGEQ